MKNWTTYIIDSVCILGVEVVSLIQNILAIDCSLTYSIARENIQVTLNNLSSFRRGSASVCNVVTNCDYSYCLFL